MVTPPKPEASRGRPAGWTKPWRTDPDRFVIAMAGGLRLGFGLRFPIQRADKVALLFHYHEVVTTRANVSRRLQFLSYDPGADHPVIRGPRQLNLSADLKNKLADGWHLDIWQILPDDDVDRDPGAVLKGEVKRITLKRSRLSTNAAFEHWYGCMAACWHAVLFGTNNPDVRLLASMRAREAGEPIYLNCVLLPLLDMAAPKKT